MTDPINPAHYSSHPSGIQAIEFCEHMTFNLGNAFKYGWRYNMKGDPVENLKKMLWYLHRSSEYDTAFLYVGQPTNHFRQVVYERKRAFARPSPWCEPVRHALVAICNMHSGVDVRERIRLTERAIACIEQAITDEECLGRGIMP